MGLNTSGYKALTYLLVKIHDLCSKLLSPPILSLLKRTAVNTQREINSRKQRLSSTAITQITIILQFSYEHHTHISQATSATEKNPDQ